MPAAVTGCADAALVRCSCAATSAACTYYCLKLRIYSCGFSWSVGAACFSARPQHV